MRILGLDSFLLPRKDCWIPIHADADQVFRHRKCKEMRLTSPYWANMCAVRSRTVDHSPEFQYIIYFLRL